MIRNTRNSVSIVLPVKNGLSYLPTLENYFELNLLPTDQLILINDGSDDGSENFLNGWKKRSQNVNLINTKGIGLVACLNLGVQESVHEWIARFDVDDLYSNNRIEYQYSAITPEAVAIFADYRFIDFNGKNYGRITSPLLPVPTALSLINNLRTAHPCAFYKKTAVIESGGYRQEDFLAEDLSLWLRMSRNGKIISVPNLLLNYRITESSTTSVNRNKAISQKNTILKSILLEKSLFYECVGDIRFIFEHYEKFEESESRKLLLVNDLIAFQNILKLKKDALFDIMLITLKHLGRPSTISELARLYFEKSQRSKLRIENVLKI
jgi:glycosyltransferase involved in cell wall biosynthesis